MTKTNTKTTTSTKTADITSALALLKGGDVIAHDRRASDATPIDFTKKVSRKEIVLRTYYGISNRMHLRLVSLASSVEYVGGMPEYHFAK